MISGNYKNTKLLLMQLRRDADQPNSRPLSHSPQPAHHESRIVNHNVHRLNAGNNHYDSSFNMNFRPEGPIQRDYKNMPSGTMPYGRADYNRERSASNVSTRSTQSANLLPGHKYVGKSEKKVYVNKADLRFDITDINNKKRKFKYSFERENPRDKEKLQNYLKAQNLDKYSKELPVRHINEVVDYKRGIYRPEESKFMESNPNNSSYVAHQNNSTYKRIDQMKMLLRKEAHNVLGDNIVITRDGNRCMPGRTATMRNTSRSPNRGYK